MESSLRDYGTVSPKFWTGDTGKKLRADPDAQRLALYLMTSPHATSTGVYYCPLAYMAHEIGITIEGASKALQRLNEWTFCEYDEASEFVFVYNMALFQVGPNLKANDKRLKWLLREIDGMPKPLKVKFLSLYGETYDLPTEEMEPSPSEAPSETPRSQDHGHGHGHGQDQEHGEKPRRAARSATRLPADFELTPERRAVAESEACDPDRTFAEFCDHWRAASGANARKMDWDATWRNWCRRQQTFRPRGRSASAAERVTWRPD